MPKTSYLNTKTQRKSKAVDGLKSISKMFQVECPTSRKFAEALEACPATAWKRLGSPAGLTLEELITACVNLGFTGTISLQNGDISAEVRW